jgi:hypothetical protein
VCMCVCMVCVSEWYRKDCIRQGNNFYFFLELQN